MGCDIHTYIEKKNAETGQWEASDKENWLVCEDYEEEQGEVVTYQGEMHSVYGTRDYVLFGLLTQGQVRRGIPKILEQHLLPMRGMPSDASPEVRNFHTFEGYDAHSANWATIAELNEMFSQYKKHYVLNMLGKWQDFEPQRMESFITGLGIPEDADPTQWRVVFWFDN